MPDNLPDKVVAFFSNSSSPFEILSVLMTSLDEDIFAFPAC